MQQGYHLSSSFRFLLSLISAASVVDASEHDRSDERAIVLWNYTVHESFNPAPAPTSIGINGTRL